MAEILPNDIGLATYNDVGEVTKLRTTAKTVVEAINEIYQNGSASSVVGEQLYVDGDDNVIFGENNVVYGNGNLVIGNDNVVVGDNYNVIANRTIRYFDPIPELYYDWFDAYTNNAYYYYWGEETLVLPLAVGDKVIVNITKNWATENWDDYISIETGLVIAEIVEVNTNNQCVKLSGIELSTTPPDDEHILEDYTYISTFIPLNDNHKRINPLNVGISFGGNATGTKSASFCSASASGSYSFATANSSATGSYANALCNSQARGISSFAANYGVCYGSYSSALNQSYVYSPYSFGTGYYARVYGRPLKCTELNKSGKYLVIDSAFSLTGISQGSKIILRCYNSYNTVIFAEFTVKSVSGQTIYLDTTSISSNYTLFPDQYIFATDNSTSYAGHSNASGYYTIASKKYSSSNGYYNIAAEDGANIWGKYGIIDEPYSLALGNGTSVKATGLAFKVLNDGSVHADAEYTTPCADYAEYFEWDDGNPQAEDRAGYFVKLCGEKIVKCGEFDKPLGIVSAKPAIIGDSGEMHWKGKFVTDDFGRVQYHDVVIPAEYNEDGDVISEEHIERQPILNPEWDSAEEYIPRKDRPEWSPIGVLGKLVVYDDGTLQSGDICRPGADGIAVKSIENGYPVLKRISDDKVLVWFKE